MGTSFCLLVWNNKCINIPLNLVSNLISLLHAVMISLLRFTVYLFFSASPFVVLQESRVTCSDIRSVEEVIFHLNQLHVGQHLSKQNTNFVFTLVVLFPDLIQKQIEFQDCTTFSNTVTHDYLLSLLGIQARKKC